MIVIKKTEISKTVDLNTRGDIMLIIMIFVIFDYLSFYTLIEELLASKSVVK